MTIIHALLICGILSFLCTGGCSILYPKKELHFLFCFIGFALWLIAMIGMFFVEPKYYNYTENSRSGSDFPIINTATW